MHRIPFPSIVASVLVMVISSIATRAATTTFSVEVPGTTPADDLVYIAGDFQGWNPGNPAHALNKQTNGTWQITLTLPDGVPIHYKFTRGSWATVEKGPFGEEIPNRTHTPQGIETVNLAVANWADGQPSTITGHVEWFEYAPFLEGRRCWVYLPPGYFESTDRYPVLYMHDGQNLFDEATSFAGEWQVDETCELLIGNGEIGPIIVVGIENNENRCYEYTPWPDTDPNSVCPSSGGGDIYLQAIRDILIPEVDLRYRTRTGADHAFMAGSSLGGLISLYAGYAYDDVWHSVAGVSTYTPWADHMLLTYAAKQPKPELSRMYQDSGTLEFGFTDENNNGIDDFIDDLRALRDIALAQGFVEGEDFLSVEGQGHTHSEFFWALRMPDILCFLIDPPAPSGDFDDDGDVDLMDYVPFVACTTGPLGGPLGEGCETFDFDLDADVDLHDMGTWLLRFSP